MGKKKNTNGIVYSTNPDFQHEEEASEQQTLPPQQQDLRVQLEKKGRKGKQVTIVKGYTGTSDALKELEKMLKSQCGTGGSAKDGEIIIQGDHRQQILEILHKNNYKAKKSGS